MKKLFLLILITGIYTVGYSQILTPVKWSYAAKKVNEKEAVVYLKATIEPGWHIYSQKVKEGGPIRTSFQFAKSDHFSPIGATVEPKAESKFDKTFDMNVAYFEKSVIFQQRIRLNAPAVTVKGSLEFMVCNDHQCLPPEEVEFTVPIG